MTAWMAVILAQITRQLIAGNLPSYLLANATQRIRYCAVQMVDGLTDSANRFTSQIGQAVPVKFARRHVRGGQVACSTGPVYLAEKPGDSQTASKPLLIER